MNVRANGKLWHVSAVTGAALLCVLILTAGLGRLATAAPSASPIYVRTDGDNLNCNGTADVAYPGGGPGLSCAVKTVQKGIDLVDSGGTVFVRAGVYAENVNVTKDLALLGAGSNSTIVDAGGSGRAVYVNSNVDLTISGFTLRNGGGFTGAGLYVAGNNALTLTHSTISNNTSCNGCLGAGLRLPATAKVVISNSSFVDNTTTGSDSYGAGIYNWRGTLTVVDSTFIGNDSSGRGGAIFSGGLGNSLTVIESTFSNNAVAGSSSYGGAIWHDTGELVISNTTIISNSTSSAGGGIGMVNGTARIYGSLIANNSAITTTSCAGGGIYNYNGTLIIEDSVLRDNQVSGGSSSEGGGILNNGRTTLNRVTVSGNSSSYRSGGIHSQAPLTMTNVTISGNIAANVSGGIIQQDYPGIFINSTIAANTLSATPTGAGGLQMYSTVNMTNTLLAYNDYANCGNGVNLISFGHNLEDSDTCGLDATGDITGTDPLLLSLGYYGGPMVGASGSQEPMRLLALGRNSPAIDAGDDAACPDVDQRGISRPVDGDKIGAAICDIGAFEFNLLNDVFLPLIRKSN